MEKPTTEITRSYPIAEGARRLGFGATKSAELVKNASDPEERARGNYLETYCVGRFRYVTDAELKRFVQARIDEARAETPEARAGKVRPAVDAKARSRAAA